LNKQELLRRHHNALIALVEGIKIGLFHKSDRTWVEQGDCEMSDIVFLDITPEAWVLGMYNLFMKEGVEKPVWRTVAETLMYLNNHYDKHQLVQTLHRWGDSLPPVPSKYYMNPIDLDHIRMWDKHYDLVEKAKTYTFGIPLRITNPCLTVAGSLPMEEVKWYHTEKA
jgi:hypothetical protein